jgi:hypothetical protein
MTPLIETFSRVILIGMGATMVMDLWLLVLKRLKVPTLNFALLGRWVGHIPRGTWAHDGIANASPIKGELMLGWLLHYATGLAFAALLVAAFGLDWARSPTLGPALAIGIGTVVLPLFVMQPAMGAGIASSRTKTPLLNCLRNLLNHTVFGAGLYVAALATACLM